MKRHIKTFAVWFLIIATIFAGNIPHADYAETPKEIQKFRLAQVKVTNMWGDEIQSGSDTYVNDYVSIAYNWRIDTEGAAVGDFFSFDVPNNLIRDHEGGVITNLRFGQTQEDLQAEGKTYEEYGTYSVSGGKLKAVLNELAIERKIQGGWFVFGCFMKAGEHKISESFTITVQAQTENTGNGGNDGGQAALGEGETAFQKNGKMDDNLPRIIAWDFRINWEAQKAQIEGATIPSMSDVFLIDEIEDEDLHISIHGFNPEIYAPMYVPTPDGKMSGLTIASPKVPVTIVEYTSGTRDEFMNQIKTAAQVHYKPAVGLFPGDESNKRTLIAYFGDLTDTDALLTYKKVLGKEIEGNSGFLQKAIAGFNSAHSASRLTTEQINRLEQIYKNDTPILAYNLAFTTEVKPKHYQFKEFYSNAGFLISTEVERSDTAKVKYRHIQSAGGAYSALSYVQVKKIWRGVEDDNYPEITVELWAEVEGEDPVKVDSHTLSGAPWLHTFARLLTQTFDGKEIRYYVTEVQPAGFQQPTSTAQHGSEGTLIEIINVKEPATTLSASSSASSASSSSSTASSTQSSSEASDTTAGTTAQESSEELTTAPAQTTASSSLSSSKASSSADSTSETTEGPETTGTEATAISTTAEAVTTTDAPTTVAVTTAATATTDEVTTLVVITAPPVTTAAPTPPPTTRTFEFIEIDEEIPLAIKTTAPLDLELILVEESIPLGGFPFDSSSYPNNMLPYTGLAPNELYIGIGLLIAAVGAVVLRRM